MIQNAVEGNWDGPGLATVAGRPGGAGGAAQDIVAFLEANKFQGLTVDFEEVPRKSQKDLQTFLTKCRRPSSHGLAIVLAVPLDDDDWAYADYANIADYCCSWPTIEHWDERRPGQHRRSGLVRKNALDKRMKTLDPNRTIVAFGGYGYDWVKGQDTQELTFEEAVFRRGIPRPISNSIRKPQSAFLLCRG